MIWFDYFALAILSYFTIRGFLSGFVRTIASLLGMVVAFLYSGWFSIKIAPFVGSLTTTNPKVLPVLSFILAFAMIYFSFVLGGFLLVTLLGKMHLTLADRILGGLLGLVKASLFITFFYLVLIIPYPASKNTLRTALTYPIVEKTINISSPLIPKSWKSFLKERGLLT
ncbi:CvpA family protein [Thermodesulfobacterium sp. TA1]|uniref:CvpA family protein n=1 Tax=Thermodesulfobacterium sp. TA1 TaxID=2234087 RepID=UPI00123289DA|nr:CvpA family protein [Thermodesulfobacterium sp. TA1]QER41437.1 CvpA family protein [Thermodesulfobacterium sp. TA1]